MKLFYRKYGSGPPLIILHGLYGSSDNWGTIAKKLGDDFTVYLPDLRNHGQSPHSQKHDYDSMRDDLLELANDLSLKKFFLAGHSMGGKVAISFALKWPERLNGLLIADISPFAYENKSHPAYQQHSNILNSILSVNLDHITTRAEVEKALAQKIGDEKTLGLIMKNLQRTSGTSFTWKINVLSLLHNLGKIMEGSERKADFSRQVTGFPVIFLRGGDSDYLPESDFNDILHLFPAAEIVDVPGAGHWIQVDKPDEVIENIRKLLG